MASSQRLGSLYTGLFLFLLSVCRLTAQVFSATNCEDSSSQAVHSLLCTLPINVNITRKEFTVSFVPDDGAEVSLVDCRWPGDGFYCFKWKGVDCVQPVSDRVSITVPGSVACKTGQFRVKIFDTSHLGKATCRPANQLDGHVDLVTQATNEDMAPPIDEETDSTIMIVGASVAAAIGMLLLVMAVVVFLKRNEVRLWLKKMTPGKRPRETHSPQVKSLLDQPTPDPEVV
ncbi:uncharacterized protein LOC112568093 [Pomacea canaliculata]|uniref:uncharacterized protein LOC112568093 n=1 Tax=Pomacea canaliculata TaxID=400727 RepID=UPI000D72544E|nr:uncharacterized protein LOC112568093 [Pomacea canaliculata]XP_025100979.1 uncharacterized protein LOC112568093 [Pomacea canaliculata]